MTALTLIGFAAEFTVVFFDIGMGLPVSFLISPSNAAGIVRPVSTKILFDELLAEVSLLIGMGLPLSFLISTSGIVPMLTVGVPLIVTVVFSNADNVVAPNSTVPVTPMFSNADNVLASNATVPVALTNIRLVSLLALVSLLIGKGLPVSFLTSPSNGTSGLNKYVIRFSSHFCRAIEWLHC